jgi:hypothetical protein
LGVGGRCWQTADAGTDAITGAGTERDHDRPADRNREHTSLEIACDPQIAAHRVHQGQTAKGDESDARRDRNAVIASCAEPLEEHTQADEPQGGTDPREKGALIGEMVSRGAVAVLDDVWSHSRNG